MSLYNTTKDAHAIFSVALRENAKRSLVVFADSRTQRIGLQQLISNITHFNALEKTPSRMPQSQMMEIMKADLFSLSSLVKANNPSSILTDPTLILKFGE